MAVGVDEATTDRMAGDGDVVVLASARTDPERELLTDWAARNHPGAPLCLDEAALGAALPRARPTTTVVPVRVTWLPPTRAAEWADGTGAPPQKPKVSDLVALLGHRRPPAFWQRRLARSVPDRVRVVEGEAATVADLRRRHDDEAREESLPAFVHRAGVLACERAERALIGDHYTVPRLVVEQIVASTRVRDRLRELAAEHDRPFEDVLEDMRARLGDLAAVQSPVAIDAFRTALAPMHAPAWDVSVDTETVEPLRRLSRTAPLVFLPTHRSYADPLVLAEVLRENDLPRNTVLGGNNMSFWPIGPLGKRAGIVFIRRSSGDDPVYKLALREYIAHLVSKRFNLEWYIEGGRSRTGKLRSPQLGLLAYLTRALDDGRAADVQLVPTSIVYDRLYELDAMAAEQGGAGKSAEGLGWLARYIRGQARNHGTARVRFGEPFSLTEALAEAGEGPARLEKVAFTICDGINRATPATPTALVTFALLGTGGRALTLDQYPGLHGAAARPPRPARAAGTARRPHGRRHLPDAGAAGHRRGRGALRRRRRDRVVDPRGPPPGRRVLPQRRDPPLRRPGDHGVGSARRRSRPGGHRSGRGGLAGGAAPARPAQVRVLLPVEAPLLRRHRGRDDAGRPGVAGAGDGFRTRRRHCWSRPASSWRPARCARSSTRSGWWRRSWTRSARRR